MSLDLTPCGHLRGVHCAKCKPAPQKQTVDEMAKSEAQDPTIVAISNDMSELLAVWVARHENPKIVIGVIMGAAIGIAQEVGVPKQDVLNYLETLWP